MKKFLIHLLIFALGLLVFNMVAFWWINREYLEDYQKVNLEYDSYMLADSHGRMLGDLTEEYGIYNFSYLGDSYVDMRRKLEYLAKKTSVTRVFIGLPDYALLPYREQQNNTDRSIDFSSYIVAKSKLGFLRDRYLKRYVVLLNPSYRNIMLWTVMAEMETFISGQNDPATDWPALSIDQQKNRAMIRAVEQYSDTTISASIQEELRYMILFCRENNIELVGIKFPVTSFYTEAANYQALLIEAFFNQYNIPLYNFQRLFDGQNEYFRDQDHLNKVGSRAFLEVLSEEVL